MALYNCPGCQQPISETQPLDHCMNCFAMYALYLPTFPTYISIFMG